jgi:hypothetical protein
MLKLPSKRIAQRLTAQRSGGTQLLIGLSLLVAALGCRSTQDNQIDLLERELRVQEDYIYELEDYIVEYSEKLRDCRSCAPSPATSSKSTSSSARSTPSTRRTRKTNSVVQDKQNRNPKNQPEAFSPEDLDIPEEIEIDIDIDGEFQDSFELEDSVGSLDRPVQLASNQAILIPDPVHYQDDYQDDYQADDPRTSEDHEADPYQDDDPTDDSRDASATAVDWPLEQEVPEDDLFVNEVNDPMFQDDQVKTTAATIPREVERLEVTQVFRGEGVGLENLLTVVEALDANNEPVDLDGEVSLMVMSTDNGRPERLKRWNFTAEETLESWQSSDLGDGLHLELPLEATQLPDGPLELWVRLVTADGRKLLTQIPFQTDQLSDLDTAASQPRSLGLTRVEKTAPSGEPINVLRTAQASPANALELVDAQEPDNRSGWRASMHRTDRSGFATTSHKSSGWAKQPAGRQAVAKLARRALATTTTTTTSKASPAPPLPVPSAPRVPTWTAGRAVSPTPPLNNPFPTSGTPSVWNPTP